MFRQRTLRRLIESISNKKCNSFYRSLSSYQNNHINYKLLQLKNNRHIKLLTSCGHYNVPVRHLKTNIISSDNIVHSPYEDVQIPNCLLHELIWENVERWPDKTAIQCGLTGRHYTFAQTYKRAKTFAASLIKSGFKPGQVISVVLPNLPEYAIVLLGGAEAGLILSPVNPVYTSDEISYQLINSKSVAVITFADKVDVIKDAISKIEQKQKEPSQIKIISIQDYDGVSRDCPPGVWSLREMFENNIDTSFIHSVCRDHNIKPENLMLLPYSSGTTGLPKGVSLTHHNIVSNVVQMSEKQCLVNQEPEGDFQDVIPVVLPFFHIYALVIVLLESLLHGGKLITLPRFQPDAYIDVLNKHRNTLLYLVPPLVLFIGSHPAIKKEHFERARYAMCAAAPLGQSDIERCMAHFPKESVFKQGYGLTETSPIATMGPNFKASCTSVGPPVSLTKMKIIDVNSKKNLGLEETGELCVHGPQVMKGYLNRPEATAEMIDEDGWLHTGDIGYYDKNGHFYIVDRIKELIKVKGFQVAPAELEELLRCHPKVADVAVIGVPDEKAGEAPVAYVVQKSGKELVTSEKELISYVAEKVTKYKQIKQVIFTDVIPKNPSGKILRRKLRETYAQSI